MKISCDVIKDILPLYAEDMVSSDTKELVECHICECNDCTQTLKSIRTGTKLPVDADIQPLKYVEKQIRSKKRWTVFTAVLLLFTVLTAVMMFLYVPVWLTADEAIEYVELMDDGFLKIKYTDLNSGYVGVIVHAGHDDFHQGFLLRMERGRVLFPAEIPPEMNEASKEGYFAFGPSYKNGEIYREPAKTNYYYMNFKDGTVEKLLWDGGYDVPVGQVMYSNDVWQKYAWILEPICYIALVLTVVFAVAAFLLRKSRFFVFAKVPAVVCAGYTVSSWIVTSGRYLAYDSFDLWMKLCCILFLTALITSSVFCLQKIHSKKYK